MISASVTPREATPGPPYLGGRRAWTDDATTSPGTARPLAEARPRAARPQQPHDRSSRRTDRAVAVDVAALAPAVHRAARAPGAPIPQDVGRQGPPRESIGCAMAHSGSGGSGSTGARESGQDSYLSFMRR